MSIEQTKIIDFISITPEGSVVLTISDHLSWDVSNQHLLLLQDKLNSYLSYIESGEIYSSYPNSKGRDILIRVMIKYPPKGDALEFLERAKKTINKAGYNFELSMTNSIATA